MLQKIHHLGIAVEDLDAATSFYAGAFGAELSEAEIVEDQGVITRMFDVGESRIELLRPTRRDSPVGRFLDKRGEGFHHAAYQVNDIVASLAALKEKGVELIDDTPRRGAGGTMMAFVHPKGAFGVLTELVELPEGQG